MACTALVAVASLALAVPASGSSTAKVALPNSVNPAVNTSTRVRDLAPDTAMSFAVTLKLRHPRRLDRFLRAVTTPGSGKYHQFLTPGEFRAEFGPPRDAVRRTTRFLSSRGLRVTRVSGNGQVIDVSGTAGTVERALDTELARFTGRHGRSFFAATAAPRLPAGVASVVRGVVGLDDHAVPRHFSHAEAAAAHDGMSPQQLRQAYDLGPLGGGAGTTIAYWEFDGYDTTNLTAYDKAYGLPQVAPTTVGVDGAHYDGKPGAGQLEVELDLEIGHGIAPKAKQLVYEAPNNDKGQIDMAAKIASDAKADVVSISWGYCEPDSTRSSMTSTSAAIKQGVAEGITYVAASGDQGSTDCALSATGSSTDAVDYPASDPNVTGVGGTTLTTGDDGGYQSETAWSGSGGGVSTVFDKPSWQRGGGNKRTVPDVAADADIDTGYAVYSGGAWTKVGGTSATAPLWAGFLALDVARHGRLGNPNPELYGLGRGPALHDVTSGSNGAFQAGPGYDQVTGWGSPDGAKLSRVLG
jgi:kumamolisin